MVLAQTLRQWRSQALDQAQRAGLGAEEVDWLLREKGGVSRLQLHTMRPEEEVEVNCSLDELDGLWQRRLGDRTPLQYLVGIAPWRDFQLRVAPGVLVPRPETELVIDIAVAVAQTHGLTQGHWADLGTGSGAIALGLARALPGIQVHGVDLSPAALAIARTNAQSLTFPTAPIHFYQGSWLDPLTPLRGHLQALISNPPYIPSRIIPTLEPEVRDHEPWLALDGGDDGLDAIRHLVTQGADFLQPGGLWLVEHMAGQSEAIQALLQSDGRYDSIQAFKDLAGRDRFVLGLRGSLKRGLSGIA